MFNLDPGKLIVIAVVAIILLGPDKLPQFARQVGGAWRTFNDFRHRMETEVRSSMPDLPPTSEIARLARSPSALLTHLSNLPSEEEASDGTDEPPGAPTEAEAMAAVATNGTGEGAPDPAPPAVEAPGENGAGATDVSGAVPAEAAVNGGGPHEGAAGTNGRPAVAPQPRDVAVPADPTLN